jgi:thiosulfate sulfurtransferase
MSVPSRVGVIDRFFLTTRNILAISLSLILIFDLSAAKLFSRYSDFMALSGADGGLSFDPYAVRWQVFNRVLLAVNLSTLGVLVLGLFHAKTHWRFRGIVALALLANTLYPNLLVLTTMTGFHWAPFSIMLVHGGGLFAWMHVLGREGPPKPREKCKAMQDIREINTDQARTFLESGKAVFVDVRDPASYEAAHVPGALQLNDSNVEKFVTQTDKSKPVVVYCYHGHTSQGAAAYLQEQGFKEVYSVIGGFELWRQTEKIES